MSHIWKHAEDVRGERLIVLLALADWANDEGECFPGMEQIAIKARVTKDGASRIIKWLTEQGYLSVSRGRGRGHKSTYIVHSEPIKGDSNDTFSEGVKGDSKSGFKGDIKGDPETEKAIQTRLKGDPDAVHIDSTRAGLTINNHHIEPSDDARGRTPQTSSTTGKKLNLRDTVFDALGELEHNQMGLVSQRRRDQVDYAVNFLEGKSFTCNDVRTWREQLPHFLGRDPTTFTAPTLNQLLRTIEPVLEFAKQNTGSGSMSLDELKRQTAALRKP